MFTWDIDPEIINIMNGWGIRWYGLLFALGFVPGYFIMKRFFREAGYEQRMLDQLLTYLVLATLIGARLGHCLFYELPYYLQHPLEILFVWKGGLASHGGVAGIVIAMILYTRRNPQVKLMWLLDRLSICTAFAAGCIRLGNFMNSEIIGERTTAPWGIIFARVDKAFPRHPAQLYESAIYFLTFGFLYVLFQRTKVRECPGTTVGLLLTIIFTARFFIEFIKENQVSWENQLALNMGQILSIPTVLAGLFLVFYGIRQRRLRQQQENAVTFQGQIPT